MSKKSMKPIALAIGTAFVTSLAASHVSAAADVNANPFAMSELSGGYMQLASGYGEGKSEKEGKCGEGKCGGKNEMKQNMEGKCGEKKSEKEGKCGEGKCGEKKEMKQNMEGKCGEKKSEKEGKCGEGKCGASK